MLFVINDMPGNTKYLYLLPVELHSSMMNSNVTYNMKASTNPRSN